MEMKPEFGNPEHIAASRRRPTAAETRRKNRLERIGRMLGGITGDDRLSTPRNEIDDLMKPEPEILELIAALEDKLQMLKSEIRYESGGMDTEEAYHGVKITSYVVYRSKIEGQLSALKWAAGGSNADQIDLLKQYREKLRRQEMYPPVTMESFLPAR